MMWITHFLKVTKFVFEFKWCGKFNLLKALSALRNTFSSWHNFAFKNSNIIIEGLVWKRKDYFTWKKFKTQKNNFHNKFYFWPNFFSYRFLSNFKKLCDSNKSWIIFSKKRFPTSPFLIFKNKFFIGWNH